MSEIREVAGWWQDVLDDLEPDTTTFTLTMSRVMAERTADAARRFVHLAETGERVEWCETHEWPTYREENRRRGVCRYVRDGNNPDCVIVSRFLYDPPEEE